jgi:hypothetical protein
VTSQGPVRRVCRVRQVHPARPVHCTCICSMCNTTYSIVRIAVLRTGFPLALGPASHLSVEGFNAPSHPPPNPRQHNQDSMQGRAFTAFHQGAHSQASLVSQRASRQQGSHRPNWLLPGIAGLILSWPCRAWAMQEGGVDATFPHNCVSRAVQTKNATVIGMCFAGLAAPGLFVSSLVLSLSSFRFLCKSSRCCRSDCYVIHSPSTRAYDVQHTAPTDRPSHDCSGHRYGYIWIWVWIWMSNLGRIGGLKRREASIPISTKLLDVQARGMLIS